VRAVRWAVAAAGLILLLAVCYVMVRAAFFPA
jgi:hypothetical protein